MNNNKNYMIPTPVVNKKEETSLVALTERYNKLVEPSIIAKAGSKIGEVIPEKIKKLGRGVKNAVTEAELYAQCMKVVAEGFNILEKQAAKMSINEKTIMRELNKNLKDNQIESLEEVCLVRSYDISKAVSTYKMQEFHDLLLQRS